jgi:hypothetical protein
MIHNYINYILITIVGNWNSINYSDIIMVILVMTIVIKLLSNDCNCMLIVCCYNMTSTWL